MSLSPLRSTLFPYTTLFRSPATGDRQAARAATCGIASGEAVGERRLRPRTLADASGQALQRDRKSTRLNSSHANNSYAVFCLKKKKNNHKYITLNIYKYINI